jgi:hypothetical protein
MGVACRTAMMMFCHCTTRDQHHDDDDTFHSIRNAEAGSVSNGIRPTPFISYRNAPRLLIPSYHIASRSEQYAFFKNSKHRRRSHRAPQESEHQFAGYRL